MAQTTPVPHIEHEHEEEQVDLEKYLKWLTPATLGILVISAFFLWQRNQGTGLRTEVAGAYQSANSADQLEAVAQAYPDQPEAPLALLQAASLRFNDQEFEAAQTLFNSFLSLHGDHPLRENAEWGLWMCTETLGDLETALNGFRSVTGEQLLYPQALLARARILEKQEQPREAIVLYTQIQETFPDSPWAEQARVFSQQVELGLR